MSQIQEKKTEDEIIYNLSELYSLEELKKLFKIIPELINLCKSVIISNLTPNKKLNTPSNSDSNNIKILNNQAKINKFYFFKIFLSKLKSYFEVTESFIFAKTISLLISEIENIEKFFISNLHHSKSGIKVGQKIEIKNDKSNKSLKKVGNIKKINYISMTYNQDKITKNNGLNEPNCNTLKNINNLSEETRKKKVSYKIKENNYFKHNKTEINGFIPKTNDINKIKRIKIDLNDIERKIRNNNLSLRELKTHKNPKIFETENTSSQLRLKTSMDLFNTQPNNLSTYLDTNNSYRKSNKKNLKNNSDLFNNSNNNLYINIFGQKKNNIIWPKPSPSALKKMENTKVKTKKEKKNTNINNIPNISLLDNIETNDFDIFELDKKTPNTLFLIGYYIFNRFGFHNIMKYPLFENWCRKIAKGYNRKNPYHTDLHAADVTQTSLTFFKIGKINELCKLNQLSKCALFLSCMCHDYKHPGFNNNYLMETKNILAIKYNDNSILENMHISEAFKLTIDYPNCDIFSGLNTESYKQMRKEMISCVLSTDMTKHKATNEFMEIIINKKKNNKNNNDIKEEKDIHQEYMNLLIHSADISNPTKKFNIYWKWAQLIVEEFFLQGDKEKELGIKCSFDRETTTIYQTQLGFINYIVIPFYSLFSEVFPKLKFLIENANNNKNKVIELQKKDNDNENNKEDKN